MLIAFKEVTIQEHEYCVFCGGVIKQNRWEKRELQL